jgi:antitoxin component YwqK of YwqJK toxin-antitoxin module
MAKTIILILVFFVGAVKAQNNCFCDTSKILNFADTSYFYDDVIVQYRLDRETGKKYIFKTVFSPEEERIFHGLDDSLQIDGEYCSWYSNGQLAMRFVYNSGSLIGAKNFVWYKNGELKAFFVNKNDTVKSTFFDENRRLSHEETSYGDRLYRTTYYHLNGFVKEVQYINQYPSLILQYYCSGVLKSIGFYSYSKPVGNFISFYEDGSVKEKGKYTNKLVDGEAKKIGRWKRYKKGRHFERIHIPPTQMIN